jgi:hypothetical protein
MKRRVFKRKSYQLKKIAVLVLLSVGILAKATLGQVIVKNPDRPKSKNAGRTVLLEEVMRIRDDGKNIIFRGPQKLSLSKDGSIFFLDYPYIYKFSKDGQFIFKALKQGEGPGEFKLGLDYFLTASRIRVNVWIPPKVMDYDMDGKYIKEIKTDMIGPFWFLGSIEGKIYGIRDEIRYSDDIWKEGFIESPYTLYQISEDFQQMKKLYDFPVKHYIKKSRWFRRSMIAAAVYDRYLFMVHTAEYKIMKFDLRSARVERIITRKYKRQKALNEEVEEDVYDPLAKKFAPPPLEYDFDIFWIHVFKNSLWAMTSTAKDKNSKPLIDVFDMEGNYIDSFYLQFPSNKETHWIVNSILSDDGFIFIPEQSEDGFVSIGKYRIKDNF